MAGLNLLSTFKILAFLIAAYLDCDRFSYHNIIHIYSQYIDLAYRTISAVKFQYHCLTVTTIS